MTLLPKLKTKAADERAGLAMGEKPKSRFESKLQGTAVRLLCAFFALVLALTLLSRAADGVTVPRVTAGNPKTGVLTQRVTGRGTIDPLGDLNLTLPGGILINNILVEKGGRVEAGDTLLELDLGDLEEQITVLQEKIRILDLRLAAAEAGATTADTDAVLAAQQRLADKEADLLRLQEKQAQSGTRTAEDAALAQADHDQAVEDYERAVEKAEKALVKAADQAIQEAEDALAAAQESAEDTIISAKASLAGAEDAANSESKLRRAASEEVDEIRAKLKAAREWQSSGADATPEEVTSTQGDIDTLEKMLEAAVERLSSFSNSSTAGNNAQRAKEALQRTEERGAAKIAEAEEKLETVRAEQEAKKRALDVSEDAAVSAAQSAVEAAEKAIRDQTRSAEDGALTAEDQLFEAQRAVEEARRGIETAEKALENASRTDETSRRQAEIERMGYRADRRALQKSLDELTAIAANGGKLTAPVSGVVQSIVDAVGKTQEGVSAAALSRSDQGFTVTCQMDQDEAQKLALGDEARITFTREGESETAKANITAIGAADDKGLVTVTADLPQGNWPTGGSAELEVSRRSAQYDTCLPISALRSEGQDDFVLVLREQRTVMGTEQTVEKVLVKVLEQDSENMAVSSDTLQRDDKVITTASKPVEEGDRVRLDKGDADEK